MSQKDNCFDNAAAENFFSHLKSELINRVKLKDYEEAKKVIDDYIRYYNNERIQENSKWLRWNTEAILNHDCVVSTWRAFTMSKFWGAVQCRWGFFSSESEDVFILEGDALGSVKFSL